MRKFLFFVVLILSAVLQDVVAQTKTVTGKVSDQQNGLGLPGVSVIVKGTSVGTATTADGTYTLNVPADGTTLIFRFIGYVPVERAIGNQGSINVTMAVDSKQLDEVIVVAYGTAEKGTFTGSASQIKTEDLAKRPVTNVVSALTGVAPGIQTTSGGGQPGDGPAIRIRGIGSANSSNTPLYVVDGVPYSGGISNINPDDIASLTILKDAAATTLYGSRASNGVIMITTKTGNKNKSQINLKVVQGVSSRGLEEYERVNAYEYYPLLWESYRNSLVYAAKNPETMDAANIKATDKIKGLLGYNPFNVADNAIVGIDGKINPNAQMIYGAENMDWEKALMRDSRRSDYSMNVNGGTEKSDYYISLGYTNDKGYLIKSDFERYTARLNVNTQAKEWFKTGINFAGTYSTSNQANDASSTGYVNPFYFSRMMGPIYPVYALDPTTGKPILDEKGNKIYDLGNMTQLGLSNRPSNGSPGRHVVAETEWNSNDFVRNMISARTFGEIKFLQNFKFTTNLSLDLTNYSGSTYQNKIVGDGAPAGRSSQTKTTTTSYTVNQLLNYNKTFADVHSVDMLLGHENYALDYNYLYGFRQGQVLDGNTELGNFTTTNSLTSSTDRHRIESYFSRINYSFDERYTLSASYRRDGSSKFSPDYRWGDFWSIGAGWRLDNETFLNLPSWVDMLKIRGSYGEIGNDGILDANGNSNYYPYMGLYSVGPSFNNASEPGFLLQTVPSPELVWEASRSFDFGFDFGLFQRVSGSVEYFHRISDNLLFEVPLPLSSGLLSKSENNGTMYNKGVELELNGDVVKTKDFTWDVNFNWTTFKNEFTKLPSEEQISGSKKWMVGKSIYDYWLREYMGVDPATGEAIYRANIFDETNSKVLANGDTVTNNINNARYHYTGSAIPDFSGGIRNTFTYKNLSLSVLMTYQVGGKVYDSNYASLMSPGSYGQALHKDMLNRWQNPGDITDVPRMDAGRLTDFSSGTSDRWLIDGSHLNIRSVDLTYTVPSAIASKLQLQGARVFLSGENLAMFAKRKGLNPSQSFSGVTSNSYSPSRIISAGLNVTL
ncbi:TonB-dependent receptor [Pontibacter sp. BT310]|uniref:TonB-dependent receptor n=1 Tax=Pontibacter populi TaxID=890055 RepID=A0ABS6X8A3_9BACT|nr:MULTISPECIES: TonB-dependent receptor [Pontibacter]MBJ6117289.1 TonB-dependent receptor [Pontibacter sp. BT310]MBR0569714.1 TonB-dependent receptor [Microvirga sp. STS03]MBW3364142.1 TonB-dependent receptor [Pontibacter populi]